MQLVAMENNPTPHSNPPLTHNKQSDHCETRNFSQRKKEVQKKSQDPEKHQPNWRSPVSDVFWFTCVWARQGVQNTPGGNSRVTRCYKGELLMLLLNILDGRHSLGYSVSRLKFTGSGFWLTTANPRPGGALERCDGNRKEAGTLTFLASTLLDPFGICDVIMASFAVKQRPIEKCRKRI